MRFRGDKIKYMAVSVDEIGGFVEDVAGKPPPN
jgi:hypothetical protein